MSKFEDIPAVWSLEEVESRLARIRILAEEGDVRAHVEQDELWLAVLKGIAAGESEVAEIAGAACRAAEIDMDRWYE